MHQLHLGANASQPTLNSLWSRIDFGPRSIRLDYERLLERLKENEQDVRETLRVGSYDMMMTCRYLLNRGHVDLKERERLEMLVLDYRLSTLAYISARGVDDGSAREIRFQPRTA